MKKLSFILFCIFLVKNSYSQNWQSVGGGANDAIRTLYSDTINDKLLIGGIFTKFGDSLFNLSVKWDGTYISEFGSWGDSLCPTWGCNHVLSFQYFEGTFFAAGTFNLTNFGRNEKYIVKWNGNDWDSTGNPDGGGHVWSTNNELFFLGTMTEISGLPAKDVARWNGTSWENFYTISPFFSDQAYCISYYQGKYIIGGNFTEPGNLNHILAFDGTQSYPLGNGFAGGICAVNDLVVYKNLLWAGGYFLENDGNVNNFIAAWDGQNWFDPFPGVYYLTQVHDLDVIDDKLHIVGNFIIPGDTALYPLAHYDGTNFCAYGGPAYNPYYPDILEVEGLNGKIYVACNKTLYGDTVNYIAEFIGTQDDTCLVLPLGLTEIEQSNNLSVYPNPFTNSFSITSEEIIQSIKIVDLTGKFIYESKPNSSETIVEPKISNGVYLIEVISETKTQIKKVIKI